MTNFEEGYNLLNEKFGNGKDNIIALATMSRETSVNGSIIPVVRGVDAYYENGVFYITTNSKSNKMQQINANPHISICSNSEMFTAIGIGENLGWILEPKNSEIRNKLRTAFSLWYDMANNENDRNCCILAIRLTKGTLNINHWEKIYHMDFIKKETMENSGIN